MRDDFGAEDFTAVVHRHDQAAEKKRKISPGFRNRGRQKRRAQIHPSADGENFHALDEKSSRLEHFASDSLGHSHPRLVLRRRNKKREKNGIFRRRGPASFYGQNKNLSSPRPRIQHWR